MRESSGLIYDKVGTSGHKEAPVKAGIRQVRDEFSSFMARVRNGEQIIISDRGRDIAVLRPIRGDDPEAWLKDLAEEGLVEEAENWVPIRPSMNGLQGDLLSELVDQERSGGW